jgi:hypothetical protein
LILLLCPLMHFFHGHGNHGHGNGDEHAGHGDSGKPRGEPRR